MFIYRLENFNFGEGHVILILFILLLLFFRFISFHFIFNFIIYYVINSIPFNPLFPFRCFSLFPFFPFSLSLCLSSSLFLLFRIVYLSFFLSIFTFIFMIIFIPYTYSLFCFRKFLKDNGKNFDIMKQKLEIMYVRFQIHNLI